MLTKSLTLNAGDFLVIDIFFTFDKEIMIIN